MRSDTGPTKRQTLGEALDRQSWRGWRTLDFYLRKYEIIDCSRGTLIDRSVADLL